MGLRTAMAAFLRELKASAAGPIIVGFDAGRPRSTPRRYDKLAEEGYTKNAVVFRCVNLISEEAAAIPWQLFTGQGDTRTLVEEHPILNLLKKPNPWMAGASFFQHVYSFRLLSGNSYIEAVGVDTGPNAQKPLELWTHRPERMKVIPSKLGVVGAYTLESHGSRVVWPVNPASGESLVLHSKSFHPLNDWYGMSPLEAAAFEVDQHNAAGAWNYSLLRNSAKPSGAFVYQPNKDGVTESLGDEEFTRLRQQIDEQMSGQFNAGRPLILEGGLDWRLMSLTPSEMDWLKGRDMSARDIAMAYDVPPQLIGIEGSQTFANFEQARLSLYEDAVLPLVDNYKDDLNMWLVLQFGEDLQLDYDEDAIPALAPRRQKKWENITTADFLTTNEKRKELGFEEIKNEPMADVVFVDLGKVPLSLAGAPPEPPADDDEDFDEDTAAGLLLLPPSGGYRDEDLNQLGALAYGKGSTAPARRNGAG